MTGSTEGWPCELSEEVDALPADLSLPGEAGAAEDVIGADAGPPYIVLTRIQVY